MPLLDDYDLDPLIQAITALDWSTDHPTKAMRAIQAIVQIKFGEELSDEDARKMLGRLLDRQFIQTRIHPDALHLVGWQAMKRKAKYIRVPDRER
jgi:hypothetical protein